jgi:ribosomal protein S18 acetylase RimI-like enzyme
MVSEVFEKKDLYEFLASDPELSVYFIGDLGDQYFQNCRWFAHKGDKNGIDALALLYHHPAIDTILTMGCTNGIHEIVRNQKKEWPHRFHSHLLEGHLPAFDESYQLTEKTEFLRMVLYKEKATYSFPPDSYRKVKVLTESEGKQIFDLLEDYPENFFALENLKTRFYFGIYEDDILVTMSGVHVVSPEFKVAALGNIVTKREYRGRGLSKLCTEFLIRKLFESVDIIALNVRSNNESAVKMYEKLGFCYCLKLYLSYCDIITNKLIG